MRFSPNGNFFASAGFDGKVFLYEGTNADLVSEIGSPAHKGGVYGVRNYQHKKKNVYLTIFVFYITLKNIRLLGVQTVHVY